jgi:hypothetical protein
MTAMPEIIAAQEIEGKPSLYTYLIPNRIA